jgi:hypothetical protein
MSSNNNWVCFKCRMAKRQPTTLVQVPMCIACDNPMFCLGYKVEVPAKEAIDAWKRLWDECSERDHHDRAHRAAEKVRRTHETEREIRRLQGLPENPDRNRYIALRAKNIQGSQP